MQNNEITQKGLSTSEVEKLQDKFGANAIDEKLEPGIIKLLKKFIQPIPLMIEAALGLSAIAKKWEDFIIIAILLGVNIGVDFIQDQKAQKALQALKDTLSSKALVLRDGKFKTIDARELVPGDIVKLVIGDIAPADLILLGNSYASVDQSAVSGESLPVDKKQGDIIFASSVIQKGAFLAQIKATGKDTSIGEDAALVAQAEREQISHFQEAILNIGRFLITIAVVLIIIVFVVLLLRGNSLLETTSFVLVLAVASVPVALPAVLSVTMAIGASKLAKKKAIITNYKAIEELAGIDILCVDKTGTLTKNQITVSSPKTYGDFTISDLFTYTVLMIDKEEKSIIEETMYAYAKTNNLISSINDYIVDKSIPFDPVRKMTEADIHSGSHKLSIVMGAPQVIISKIDDKLTKQLNKDVEVFARDGFRTIIVAQIKNSRTIPVGIIPLVDPPREDSKQTISEIRSRGIVVKMLTGDNVTIATYVSKLLDIGTRVIRSSAMQKLLKTKNAQARATTITANDVFAEVVPKDKFDIVETLQKTGHLVAMTGDGVNDAPALKKADIGIAVSGASPAARSAADIILLDSGLAVISYAIDSARMIFYRMKSYATFRIALTIRIIFFIALSILVYGYSPLTAVMIILLALLDDIPVMSIAYDNAPVNDRPTRWHLREIVFISILLGMSGLISSFALFIWLDVNGFSVAIIQTILFLKLDVAGHSTLYLTRTGSKHFWERPFPSLQFFIPAFGSRIIGTIIVLFGILMSPISWQTILFIWIYSTIWFLFNDQLKVLGYKILDKLEKKRQLKQA